MIGYLADLEGQKFTGKQNTEKDLGRGRLFMASGMTKTYLQLLG